MKKIITGSVLAAGVAASLFGAGTAQADPGVSVNVGGTEFGIGDHGAGKSADARATGGNVAVAVNTGLNLVPIPSSIASAGASNHGTLNTAVAIDGVAVSEGFDTHTFAALGASEAAGRNNNVVTVGGQSGIQGAGNQVVNFAGNAVGGNGPTDAPTFSVNVCGAQIGGQGHVTVSAGSLC